MGHWLAVIVVGAAALVGCGGNDCCTIDAAIDAPADVLVDAVLTNPGFSRPTSQLSAWTSPSQGTFQAAPLDLSCLGASRSDSPTTVTVTLGVHVTDFQSGNIVPSAMVGAFDGTTITSPFVSTTTDSGGNATLTIPTGRQRIGFSIASTSARNTYVLDRILAPSTASQSMALQSMSNATFATLPALVGLTPISGSSIELGTARDCQGHSLSSFIATVSSARGIPAHLGQAKTFYFSDAVGLPTRNQPSGARDGQFMVMDLTATSQAYVQIWGFRDLADLTAGTLTLIEELAVPVPGDSTLLTDQDPRATQ
ncbi:MAG TPA: hypothetical protein VLB44_22180 [Kofleriaceae bacterium]|nr:hypothetical protein [Kofleriaceae bacterium]